MNGEDEEEKSGQDDFKKAAGINFRDYPSTTLVVLGAVSSGLAWALYKWLGRKGTPRNEGGDTVEPVKGITRRATPSDDESP